MKKREKGKFVKMARKKVARERRKKWQARVYLNIGIVIAILAMLLGFRLWNATNFLPGIDPTYINWWKRKALYILLCLMFFAGIWLCSYAGDYLR